MTNKVNAITNARNEREDIFPRKSELMHSLQYQHLYLLVTYLSDLILAARAIEIATSIFAAHASQAATPLATLPANQAVTSIAAARPNQVDTPTIVSHARASQAVTPIVAARAVQLASTLQLRNILKVPNNHDIQIATTTASLSFLNIRPSVHNPTELPSTSHANDGNSSKSRLIWLEADVFRLISIWREFNEKPKYRQIGKTLSLWSDKNLVQKYKQLRDGTGLRKAWKFYDVLNDALHNKPEIALPNIRDIGKKKKGASSFQDDDSDDSGPTKMKKKKLKASDFYEDVMVQERRREEKEDLRFQSSKANEDILLGFVRELKESSERKAVQAEKNGQHFAALASALISNINQTNQSSK
ncbi:hypothetical protein OUZ56_021830 [Daphnia magna]|uniref:MADF domain-containing protein n=2 Tax=Daphnia magna TaxID=35525 RepID=A0ABR0AUJ8_9CRUS|nr:hypothetical protein OUZ56_021830 [Daphnia magna]